MPEAQEPQAALLATVAAIARDVLAPSATQTDRSTDPPLTNLKVLAESGFYGLTIPVLYGGLGQSRAVVRECQELLSASCGATAFLFNQHVIACGRITAGTNDGLKQKWLPRMAKGETFVTLGLSDIRRPIGEVRLKAKPEGDGLMLDGLCPWMSGAGVADAVILGAELPDGRIAYCLVPLDDPALTVGKPFELSVMGATNTADVLCSDLYVGPESLIAIGDREQVAAGDLAGLVGSTTASMGVSRAALAQLRELALAKSSDELLELHAALSAETDAIRAGVARWDGRVAEPPYREAALDLRAHALEHALRAAHALVVACGGSAMLASNPAQRLFREAMHYSASNPQVASRRRLIERLTREAAT